MAAATRAALLVMCVGCPQAQANEAGSPFVLEANGGWQGPIGSGGLALVYDRGGVLSAGLGVGIDVESSHTFPAVGVFGRVRALRAGPFSLGLAATFSGGRYASARSYIRPFYFTRQDLSWTWEPGYRITGAVAAELAGKRWSLRVEGGVGYLLNQPTCTYDTTIINHYSGSCNSPSIPAAYHFAVQPGRVLPTVTASLGYRFGVVDQNTDGEPVNQIYRSPSGDPQAAGSEFKYKSPNTALILSLSSTFVPMVAGAIMVSQGFSYNKVAGIAVMGLGLSFGPSIGYAYSGEHLRGWGVGALRMVGLGVATFAALYALIPRCGDCSSPKNKDATAYLILAMAAFTPVVVSAVYDIATAPRAARRANERHGLTNPSLVPVAIPGRSSTSPGLALVGQF